MPNVTVTEKPDMSNKRLAFALAEDRVGHYPEFRMVFVRTFDLDHIGLSEPGYIRAPSGRVYAVVFIGRSGQPFPSGVEVYAIVDALEPIGNDVFDTDLWAILRWMINSVGGAWSVKDFDATGRDQSWQRLCAETQHKHAIEQAQQDHLSPEEAGPPYGATRSAKGGQTIQEGVEELRGQSGTNLLRSKIMEQEPE